MSRRSIILNTLSPDAARIPQERLLVGLTASEISELTGIERSNVSRELNALVRSGDVIKSDGRPVRFFYSSLCSEDSDADHKGSGLDQEQAQDEFFFTIGQDGSLKKQVNEAKAAVLYPSNGLHTLLLGPTGTGKSFFAERMFEYAKEQEAFAQDASFVVFNCAEYAENPQLILSQLFGHKKGAFTGADRDKRGLVEQAAGGMLFLDEIHRLPPEGQEMLFLLMDKGVYRRLGETDNQNSAKLMIVGATTESKDTSLLQTFLRRMPMVIHLPALRDRPIEERIQLIHHFFAMEEEKTRLNIHLHADVIRRLTSYLCPGNVGQLHSDIQLICAKSYLRYRVAKKDALWIEAVDLPQYISGSFSSKREQDYVNFMLKGQEYYTIDSSRGGEGIAKYGDSVYKEIDEKYYQFRQENKNSAELNRQLEGIVNSYIQSLLQQNVSSDKTGMKMLDDIDPAIRVAVDDALSFAQIKLERPISAKVRIGLMLHVDSMLARLREGRPMPDEGATAAFSGLVSSHTAEYRVARQMIRLLESELDITVPPRELEIITLFLSSLDEDQEYSKVGIVILAHGNSTASSMAELANSLFQTTICRSIDMPLGTSVEKTLELAIKEAQLADEGKGVLFLVDMGSLATFAERVEEHCGITVRSVEMVTTITVIEAVRKALVKGMDIDRIMESVCRIGEYRMSDPPNSEMPKSIIVTCISGIGAAVKIGNMIKEYLKQRQIINVEIQHMNISDKQQSSAQVFQRDLTNVIAVAGTVDLKLEHIPYISVEEIVAGDGLSLLESLFHSGATARDVSEQGLHKDIYILVTTLEKMLDFLSPEKVVRITSEAYQKICDSLALPDDRAVLSRFVIHCSCMAERLIRGEVLPYNGLEDFKNFHSNVFGAISEGLEIFEEIFSIKTPDTEIAYLAELFLTQ